jgi:hypothetical protein
VFVIPRVVNNQISKSVIHSFIVFLFLIDFVPKCGISGGYVFDLPTTISNNSLLCESDLLAKTRSDPHCMAGIKL